MAHGDAWEGKWRVNWRMEWVTITLHTTSEHGVSNITTADAHTSAASSRLNWRPRRFKWIHLFRRKTKSGFCACAITFQTRSTSGKDLTVCMSSNFLISNTVKDAVWAISGAGCFRHNNQNKVTDVSKWCRRTGENKLTIICHLTQIFPPRFCFLHYFLQTHTVSLQTFSTLTFTTPNPKGCF
jgi:hypothetical protein